MIIFRPQILEILTNPRRFWRLYIPGTLFLLMGIFIIVMPEILAIVISTLFLCLGLFLVFLTRKIYVVLKTLKEREDVSEIDMPDNVRRFIEHEPQKFHWIN